MLDVSIVMPAWTLNDQIQKMTESAIDSVSGIPLTIIDNASPQGGGYLRNKATTYIRNNENLGFAKAVNQGIKLSKTRYVAVVSTDVRVSPNWREVAEKAFTEDAFSVHFRMLNYNDPFVYGDSIIPTGKERWCTAAMFVLDTTKPLFFDEKYFNSCEDSDLFTTAWANKFKTVYTDKACYQHAHSFTQQFVGFPGTQENKEIFKKKWGDYPDVLFEKMYPEQMKVNYWEGFVC